MIKKSPTYPLDAVQSAAIKYISLHPGAEKDKLNLVYETEDVIKCICSLKLSNYCYSENYSAKPTTQSRVVDIYTVKYIKDDKQVDELFIKFFLSGERVIVISFHLERGGHL